MPSIILQCARFGIWTLLLGLSSQLQLFAEAGKIEGKLEIPESPQKKSLPALNTTLITLNDGQFSTYTLSPDNTFTFHNVPPGVHVLDVHSSHYHFSQVKIQLLKGDGSAGSESQNDPASFEPKCIEYYYPGSAKHPLASCAPLILYANAQYQYFFPRPSFSPFVFLKNPMILIMIFSVGMMFIMPSMMSNLDPEQKEQMKKQMEAQQDPTKMLSQLWGEMSGGAGVAGAGAGGTKEISEKKVVKKQTRLKRE